ncbi:MAG: rhamnulose-1-phosphate aldolase [Synergistaceae bacterium]|nr:rhamnulose-1-phosphate aldolase [Synergistaceae bacterium]
MNILQTGFMRGFVKMAGEGFRQGWHERNGGNLSYRLKPEERASIEECFRSERAWLPIGAETPEVAGEAFVVTGTGKYFSNIPEDPEDNCCIIELDSSGLNYRMVWGLSRGGRPTSELPTHLMTHAVKKNAADGQRRVIYHSHPANVIALTFVLPLTDAVFTRELWESVTECSLVFPAGVGVVDWMVPGGRNIALATSELMRNFDVAIWAHHGLFCSGEDFDTTFGLAHTVEKAAEILVKTMSMSPLKRQTISPEQLRELARDFHVSLPEKFLYEKRREPA